MLIMNRVVKASLWMIAESKSIYAAEAESVSGPESGLALMAPSKCDSGSRLESVGEQQICYSFSWKLHQ